MDKTAWLNGCIIVSNNKKNAVPHDNKPVLNLGSSSRRSKEEIETAQRVVTNPSRISRGEKMRKLNVAAGLMAAALKDIKL